jgi:hypothetical protein
LQLSRTTQLRRIAAKSNAETPHQRHRIAIILPATPQNKVPPMGRLLKFDYRPVCRWCQSGSDDGAVPSRISWLRSRLPYPTGKWKVHGCFMVVSQIAHDGMWVSSAPWLDIPEEPCDDVPCCSTTQ